MVTGQLTDIEARALVIIARSPTTCASLGDQLWHKGGRGNCSCPFARPAGVVVKRLKARGFVERELADVLTLYTATRAGRAALEARRKGGGQ